MAEFVAKKIEAGADWLTGTSQSDASAQLLYDLWSNMVDELEISRAFREKASWMGYDGEKIEHGFLGERKGQVLVRLSGALAYNYAWYFVEAGARPSRLDFQITAPVGNVSQAIERMFDQARVYTPSTGRPPAVKAFVDRRREFEGCYIGRRQSEVFVRIYDKGKESRLREYTSWLRVEAELKAGTARRYAAAWHASVEKHGFIRGCLEGLCQARGMVLPFANNPGAVFIEQAKRVTPAEAKAHWLRTQVAPTVQTLIDEVGWGRVISLLFPDSHRDELGYNAADGAAPMGSC